MKSRKEALTAALVLLVVLTTIATSCVAPTPSAVEKVVVETQIVEKKVVETLVVEKKVVETQVVEKQVVVTATPIPPKLGQGKTLTWASTEASQAAPFSPFYCNSGYCYIPMNPLLLGLTQHNEKGEPVPALAEKWEANATADVWTFSINPKAVWSDGLPITAQDVAWSYKTGLHPDTGGFLTRQANLGQIKGAKEYMDGKADDIAGIEVVDDKTIKFTLELPNAVFANEMWQPIVPPQMYTGVANKDIKTNEISVNGPTIFSGPLKLVKREGDTVFDMEPNEKYWGKPLEFNKIVVKSLNDDVSAAQLEAGEIEYGRIPASEAARLASLPHLDVVWSPVDLFYDWIPNTRKPYLQDKRVRQALTYALNRQEILEYAWEGNGLITVPPFAPDWAVNPDLDPYPYDPEKAKKLLDEAGWDWKQKLILMVGPWPDNVKPAEITQAQWNKLGLNVEIRLISGSAWATEMEGMDWDIGMLGGFYGGDPSKVANDFVSDSYRAKITGWSNAELDDLAAKGLATTDQAERQKIYWRIAEIINDELPQIPLYATGTPYAVNKGLKGVRPPGLWFFMPWNISDWSR